MFAKRFVFIALLAVSCASCVNKDKGFPPDEVANSSATNLSRVLEQTVDGVVIPTVEMFGEKSKGFNNAANNFCTTINDNNLNELQQQWISLLESWYRLSIYNFGPLNDDLVFPAYTFVDSLRLRGTDYTETVRDEISSDIAGTNVLNTAYFSAKTFQQVGLLALESAVFETAAGEHSQTASDIVNEYQNSARKCEVLSGMAEQVDQRASYVISGWTTAHKGSSEAYRTLFLNNELEDGTEAITQLISSVQEFLDYLQKRDVVNTTAQISERSWQAIVATVDEVELLLQGDSSQTDSFLSFMESTGNQNAVDTIRATIVAVRKAITERDAAMLDIALGQLDGNFKREVPDSLDVELGINFTDGD